MPVYPYNKCDNIFKSFYSFNQNMQRSHIGGAATQDYSSGSIFGNRSLNSASRLSSNNFFTRNNGFDEFSRLNSANSTKVDNPQVDCKQLNCENMSLSSLARLIKGSGSNEYELKKGENFSKVANKFNLTNGELNHCIKAANPEIKNPKEISAGTKINIPNKEKIVNNFFNQNIA